MCAAPVLTVMSQCKRDIDNFIREQQLSGFRRLVVARGRTRIARGTVRDAQNDRQADGPVEA